MRALCDAILVGSGTLACDQPSLTCRLVPGENPRRIVIGNSAKNFDSLIKSSNEKVWVLGHGKMGEGVSDPQINFESFGPLNGRLKGLDILEYLYSRGILSVYIEGGAETTSSFLSDNAIDILQLHLSPQIFGSGVSGLVLPDIDKVGEAIRFERFCFQPVGNTFMFVGEPIGEK
jgi:riboflavin biosynthesis pyrimidine reductase